MTERRVPDMVVDTTWSIKWRMEAAEKEIERLRSRLHRHYEFARFIHLWTHRDNVTDAERVSVIKHHPSLRNFMGENADDEQSATNKD